MLVPRSALPRRLHSNQLRRTFGFFPWHRLRRHPISPLPPKDAARCGGAQWPIHENPEASGWTWEIQWKDGRIIKNRKRTFGDYKESTPARSTEEWKMPELENEIDFITMKRKVPEVKKDEKLGHGQKKGSFSEWRTQPEQRQATAMKKQNKAAGAKVVSDKGATVSGKSTKIISGKAVDADKRVEGVSSIEDVPGHNNEVHRRPDAATSSVTDDFWTIASAAISSEPSPDTPAADRQKEMTEKIEELSKQRHPEELESEATVKQHKERIARENDVLSENVTNSEPATLTAGKSGSTASSTVLQTAKVVPSKDEDQTVMKVVSDTTNDATGKASQNYNQIYGTIGNKFPEKAVLKNLRNISLKEKVIDKESSVSDSSETNPEKDSSDGEVLYDNFTGEAILPEDYDAVESSEILMKLEAKIEEWKNKAEKLENDLDLSYTRLGQQKNQYDHQIQLLNKEICDLRTEITALEKLRGEVQTVKNESSKWKAKVEDLEKEENILQSQVRGLSSELDQWKTKAQDLKDEKARAEMLKHKVESRKAYLAKLIPEVKTKMVEAQKWSADADAARTRAEEQTKRNSMLELESYGLQEEVAKLKDDVRDLESEYSKWEGEVLKYEAKADKTEHRARRLKDEIETLESQSKALKSDVKDRQTVVEHLDIGVRERKDKMGALNRQLAKLKEETLEELDKRSTSSTTSANHSTGTTANYSPTATPAEQIAHQNWTAKMNTLKSQTADTQKTSGNTTGPRRKGRIVKTMFWASVWVGGLSGAIHASQSL